MGGPSFPTSFFIQSYISRFEYSAQVLKLHRNRSLFFKVQRQQYRIIRSALGFRQFTPINILLAKSCEPPLELRFALLSSRYVYKCFARSSVLSSAVSVDLRLNLRTHQERIQLLRSIAIFRSFILQKCSLPTFRRTVTPALFSYNFSSIFPIPQFASFDILDSLSSGKNKKHMISVVEVRERFREFAAPQVNGGISIFTDGSRRIEDDEISAVGAAVYSLDLQLALKHKLLKSET